MYPLVGFGYFYAGFTGLAIFLIIARLLNGLGYAFDSVGRSTYFRRHSPQEIIGTVFGYFDSITSLFWVLCVLASIILAINVLFLAIVPTTIITLLMFLGLKKDENTESTEDGFHDIFKEKIAAHQYVGVVIAVVASFAMGLFIH